MAEQDGITALEACKAALVAAGYGVEGQDLFMGFGPDGIVDAALEERVPDEALFLTEGDGQPGLTMGLPVAIERPLITIRVRGTRGDYVGPKKRIMGARLTLAGLQDYQHGSVRLMAAVPQGSILPLEPDEAGRHEFTATFATATEPITAA